MEWNLKTFGGVFYEEHLWFSNNTFNGLFRMNLDSGNIELMDFFPNEKRDLVAAHKKCICYNGKLFFFPANANNIHIYDISKQKFTVIPIDRDSWEYCGDAILVGEKIYIFMLYTNQDVLVLNTQDLSLHKIPSFRTAYRQITKNDKIKLFLCRCSEYNGKIYTAFHGTDVVVSFDVKTEELIFFHTGIEDIFFCYVYDGKCWIITWHTGDVYQYDFRGEPVLMHSGGNKKDIHKFNQIISYADRIWAIPAYPGSMICFDHLGNKKIYDDFAGENPEYILFFGTVLVKDEMWLLPHRLDYIYALNRNGELKKKDSFIFQDEKRKGEILAGLLEERNILCEHENLDLHDFLKAVNYTK